MKAIIQVPMVRNISGRVRFSNFNGISLEDDPVMSHQTVLRLQRQQQVLPLGLIPSHFHSF